MRIVGFFAILTLVPMMARGETFDLERITADLFANDVRVAEPEIFARHPGVIVGAYRSPSDLVRARKFASLLNARGGDFTIRVQHGVNEIGAPAFNGLLLQGDRPLANLKLVNFDSRFSRDLKGTVVGALARLDRFSEREAWVQWQMKNARALAGVAPESTRAEVQLNAHRAGRYHRRLRAVRQLQSVFAPGTRRPAWILVDSTNDEPLTDQLKWYLAHMTKKSVHVPVIMVLQKNTLTTFFDDNFSQAPVTGCESGLIRIISGSSAHD